MTKKKTVSRRRVKDDDRLPDVVAAGASDLDANSTVPGKLSIKSRGVVYTSPSGRFTVERLKPSNYPEYKRDLVRMGRSMPDPGPVGVALGDYVNSYVRRSLDAGLVSGMQDTSDFIAKLDGKVVGYILGAPITKGSKKEHRLFLGGIGVDTRQQGKGIGSALYWVAANEAVRRVLPGMTARSLSSNEDANEMLGNIGFKTENPETELQDIVSDSIPYRWRAQTDEVLRRTQGQAAQKIAASEGRSWRRKEGGRHGRAMFIDFMLM
jgi:ribosomal protein S18 acetylase RimI-like enzyme